MEWFYITCIIAIVGSLISHCVDRHYEYKETAKWYELSFQEKDENIGN